MKIRSQEISYLGNRSWQNVTREERFFTAILFYEFCLDMQPFLNLLLSKKIIKKPMDAKTFEPGFEVCLFRDLQKVNNPIKIGNKEFSLKRTFDLVLFSETLLIIVEAKANQQFHKKQLESIHNEEINIKRFLSGIYDYKCPDVLLIALISEKYHPKDETKSQFANHIIFWNEIANYYPDSYEIFHNANDCYRK